MTLESNQTGKQHHTIFTQLNAAIFLIGAAFIQKVVYFFI
jgi:hypothetical protein